jgi:hypothetical protein
MMSFTRDDDAVSEMVGYTIMTGIIITAIAIVLMIGYPMFQKSITDAHMTNMAEGFNLLSSNGNKVAMYESPVQSSELKIYSGTLYIKNEGNVHITYNFDTTGTTEMGSTDYADMKALEYASGGTKVAYYMGGVFKKEGDAVSMLEEPPIYYDGVSDDGVLDTLVLPIVVIDNDAQALGGTGVSRVTISTPYYSKSAQTIPSSKPITYSNIHRVVIDTNGEFSEALIDYFSGIEGFDPSQSDTDTIVLWYNDAIDVHDVAGHITIDVN